VGRNFQVAVTFAGWALRVSANLVGALRLSPKAVPKFLPDNGLEGDQVLAAENRDRVLLAFRRLSFLYSLVSIVLA
jgi:hypothetical protein